MNRIAMVDSVVASLIRRERNRQERGLEMIASENFVSVAVMQAMGSVATNKYAEGYPGRRYYGGNEVIDEIESLTIERARELFGTPHANVQPYSGSPANFAVYLTVCKKPEDRVLGMLLKGGGHLTHGQPVSATGMLFNTEQYGVTLDGYIDLDQIRDLALKLRPKLIWVGATAYARKLPFKEIGEIADEVGAISAADIAHVSGLVVSGDHESPANYVHIITTTTHKTLRGPRAAMGMITQKGLDRDPNLGANYDKAIFPGLQGGPHENTIAGIAVALNEAAQPEFKEYGHQIIRNSKALAASLMQYGIKLVTGGTDNHMALVDLTPYGIGTGIFVEKALEGAGITVNKNTVPNDPSTPYYPSGIRIGVPALTTRGMREREMTKIGRWIADVINSVSGFQLPPKDAPNRGEVIKQVVAQLRESLGQDRVVTEVKDNVVRLCEQFPLYPNFYVLE